MVSGLPQQVADTDLIVLSAQVRNYGFNTPVGGKVDAEHNSIRACVDGGQIVRSGSPVRLRLLETMQTENAAIPENTVIFGTARISGQRMSIVVTGIEYGSCIIPVELSAYDLDGMAGLNIPSSQEREAAKNAAANMGAGLGTSVSFTRSAGQQVAMDLVRGVMSGGSQYAATKLREVKIALKANYQLLLISKK